MNYKIYLDCSNSALHKTETAAKGQAMRPGLLFTCTRAELFQLKHSQWTNLCVMKEHFPNFDIRTEPKCYCVFPARNRMAGVPVEYFYVHECRHLVLPLLSKLFFIILFSLYFRTVWFYHKLPKLKSGSKLNERMHCSDLETSMHHCIVSRLKKEPVGFLTRQNQKSRKKPTF